MMSWKLSKNIPHGIKIQYRTHIESISTPLVNGCTKLFGQDRPNLTLKIIRFIPSGHLLLE